MKRLNKKMIKNSTLEVRSIADSEEMVISGYFAVFEDQTELYEGVFEKIDRNAFEDFSTQDVKALINHDDTKILGRTGNQTLKLKIDEKGLFGEIFVNNNDQEAVNFYHRVKRGDINKCSFGFNILEEDMEKKDDGNSILFTLKKVRLIEVSCVTFPAYENTLIEARKEQLNENEKRTLEIKKQNLKNKLKGVK